jgi:hypothetical protein
MKPGRGPSAVSAAAIEEVAAATAVGAVSVANLAGS